MARASELFLLQSQTWWNFTTCMGTLKECCLPKWKALLIFVRQWTLHLSGKVPFCYFVVLSPKVLLTRDLQTPVCFFFGVFCSWQGMKAVLFFSQVDNEKEVTSVSHTRHWASKRRKAEIRYFLWRHTTIRSKLNAHSGSKKRSVFIPLCGNFGDFPICGSKPNWLELEVKTSRMFTHLGFVLAEVETKKFWEIILALRSCFFPPQYLCGFDFSCQKQKVEHSSGTQTVKRNHFCALQRNYLCVPLIF